MNPSWKKDRYAKKKNIDDRRMYADSRQDAGSTVSLLQRIFISLSYKTTFIPADNFLYLDPYTPNCKA